MSFSSHTFTSLPLVHTQTRTFRDDNFDFASYLFVNSLVRDLGTRLPTDSRISRLPKFVTSQVRDSRSSRVRDSEALQVQDSRLSRVSHGPPWAHYLDGYHDRLLGGPLGLPDLCRMVPVGVRRKDHGGEVLG
jgi:hypothetical protein